MHGPVTVIPDSGGLGAHGRPLALGLCPSGGFGQSRSRLRAQSPWSRPSLAQRAGSPGAHVGVQILRSDVGV